MEKFTNVRGEDVNGNRVCPFNKSTESYEPLKGKHTIILELLQRGDKHSYVKG